MQGPSSRPDRGLRRVVLSAVVSLDGYLSSCEGAPERLPWIGDLDPDYRAFLARIDTLVLGRKTYERRRAQLKAMDRERCCVVFSRTRGGQRDDAIEFRDGDVVDLMNDLRVKPGLDVWLLGGAEVIGPCLAGAVVDEIRLIVVPVMLGEGTPLFLPIARSTELSLRNCQSLADGVVINTYDVVK